LGDLIGFEGYLNGSTPFEYGEHNAVWKTSRRYLDFDIDDGSVDCTYPRFWGDDGEEVDRETFEPFKGRCRKSEFDQVMLNISGSSTASTANSS
jgi:alpha-1,3-glucan synthase